MHITAYTTFYAKGVPKPNKWINIMQLWGITSNLVIPHSMDIQLMMSSETIAEGDVEAMTIQVNFLLLKFAVGASP